MWRSRSATAISLPSGDQLAPYQLGGATWAIRAPSALTTKMPLLQDATSSDPSGDQAGNVQPVAGVELPVSCLMPDPSAFITSISKSATLRQPRGMVTATNTIQEPSGDQTAYST